MKTETVLLEYEVPMAGLMALRERWRLDARDGMFVVDGRELPAVDLDIEPVERVMLGAQLNGSPVSAEPLIELLSRPGLLEESGGGLMPALLERTVRISSAEAPEAFRRVAEVVVE